MRRADRKRWGACHTLDDLCAATVGWLHGEIIQTPSHLGPPCRETIPLLGVLEAANLAGFLTDGSQPGIPLEDGCGQRAAVEGFATDDAAQVLAGIAGSAGLLVITGRAPRFRTRYTSSVVVTMDQGYPFTSFGAQRSRRDLRADFSYCQTEATEAVCDAWQVCLIDPEWGRNDVLWPALEKFASERGTA